MSKIKPKPTLDAFAWRFSFLTLLAYLLATLPQTIIDPLLTSQVKYGARTYHNAYMVIIMTSIVLFPLALWTSQQKFMDKSLVFPMVPFFLACVINVPVFRPELPHGNLIFVGMAWIAIASATLWAHHKQVEKPTVRSPKASTEAQIEFIKEQSLFWRTAVIAFVGAYLVLLVNSIKETHNYNLLIVKGDMSQVFILDMYAHIQFGMISLFVLFGPLLELGQNAMQSRLMFLDITNDKKSSFSRISERIGIRMKV